MTGARLHRPGHPDGDDGEPPSAVVVPTVVPDGPAPRPGPPRRRRCDRPSGAHLAHVPAVRPESEMRVEGGDAVDRGQRHPSDEATRSSGIDREMPERLLHGVQHFDETLGTVAELAHPDSTDRHRWLSVAAEDVTSICSPLRWAGPASRRPGARRGPMVAGSSLLPHHGRTPESVRLNGLQRCGNGFAGAASVMLPASRRHIEVARTEETSMTQTLEPDRSRGAVRGPQAGRELAGRLRGRAGRPGRRARGGPVRHDLRTGAT